SDAKRGRHPLFASGALARTADALEDTRGRPSFLLVTNAHAEASGAQVGRLPRRDGVTRRQARGLADIDPHVVGHGRGLREGSAPAVPRRGAGAHTPVSFGGP